MAGPRTHRRLAVAVLAIVAVIAPAQEPLRFGPVGDSTPIQFAADEIATWKDGPDQVFLLRGRVLVEQDLLQLRCNRAVLSVDVERQKRTGTYAVRVAADGDVRVENGSKKQTSTVALAELMSRLAVRTRASERVVEKSWATDEFVRWARTLAPKEPIQQVAGAAPPRQPDMGIVPTPALKIPASPTQNPGGVQLQPPEFPPQPGTPLPTAPMPSGQNTPVPPPKPAGQPIPPRVIKIAPRRSTDFDVFTEIKNGERVTYVNGGVIVIIRDIKGVGLIDIEADRAVIWSKGDSSQVINQMSSPEGKVSQEHEFYLEGDVQIRSKSQQSDNLLQAERAYYDVNRNVAVAVQADLELRRPDLPDPLHMKAEELLQISPTRFEAVKASVFSSKLPSDPGLTVVMTKATVEDKKVERRNLFGGTRTNPETGQPLTDVDRIVTGENAVLRIEGVPVFYLPYFKGNARDPLGPLQSAGFRQDRIFGTQILTTWDMFNLLHIDPPAGTKWNLELDYLSSRGPAIGSDYSYGGRDLFGFEGPYTGGLKLYGIRDDGLDVLGGDRGNQDNHPLYRGRALFRHRQQFGEEWSLQAQGSYLSDKNFLEQYYKTEFDSDPNQQTFAYLKWQRENYNVTGLVQPNIRPWVTEDVWLPRVNANLIGQSFFDLFTYNVRGNVGYAELHTTSDPPPPYVNTDVPAQTGRFDVFQELSLPFYLGPMKVVPYGVLDLTAYTQDLNDDGTGRVYGGGGVRSSLPLTRVYPGVQSDLFNLNGINHKIVFGTNYFLTKSNEPYTNFPQLDRLNDDATDQALRDITPRQPSLNPTAGVALKDSPIFNPQLYAIRRALDNRVDTIDSINVLQMDVRQRWQTKRGFPGQEHIVDYITLDLSASYFPQADRDNFGEDFAFLEYDTTWNIGDRTSIVSSGLYDPFENGTRVFTIGAYLNRPDRTSFFVGYRQIDPVQSRAVTGSATYIFSPKYAITANSVYDFGINQSLSNSLVISRVGSDLTLSLGVTYNALVNNFGLTLEILPNAVALTRKSGQAVIGRGLLQ